MNRFEEFLKERWADASVDNDFEDWLSKLDIDEFLNYGEWFGNMLEKKALEKRIEELEAKIKGGGR